MFFQSHYTEKNLFFSIFAILLLSSSVIAFETDEMQMFDLVEEVNQSFYDFLGVPQDASNSVIKKAYRKLSLSMHPDKNPDNPKAEKQFRQLTAIYAVLKDEEMREKYDNVLEFGLPDWKQPAFYYRQLRKMGGIELGVVSLLIAICIHYACIWGIAYETRWTKTEQLAILYKRHKANSKKKQEIDKQIQSDVEEHVPLPGFKDILPFAVMRGVWKFFLILPFVYREISSLIRSKKDESKGKEDQSKIKFIERQKQSDKKAKSKVKSVPKPVNLSPETLLEIHDNLNDLDTSSNEIISASNQNADDSDNAENEGKDWLDDQVNSLVSLINTIPSGTPKRWTKIAKKMGRSEKEVIQKSKQLHELSVQATKREEFRLKKAHEAKVGDTSAFTSGFEINENPEAHDSEADQEDQYYSKKRANKADSYKMPEPTVAYDASISNENEESEDDGFVKLGVDDVHVSRKKQRQQGKNAADGNADSQSTGWTQAQQKMLEAAMKSIVKGTDERWERIAECVEGKTKEEVVARAKYLAQKCKKSDEALFANL